MTLTKLDQIHGERRLTFRLPCHLAVSSEGTVIGEVEDVSLDGIRLATNSQLLQNYQYKFQLPLPAKKQSISFVGRILYRHDKFYGVRIEQMDRKSKGLFEKFVIALRESCQIRDIIESLKGNKATLTIEDKRTIKDLLLKTRENHLPLKISLTNYYQPLTSRLEEVQDESIVLGLKAPLHNGLHGETPLYVVVMIDYHSFYFEAGYVGGGGSTLVCSFPSRMFFSDRRREERVSFENSGVTVQITGPLGSTIEGRLIDYSSNGARIRLPRQSGIFFVRTPLDEVILSHLSQKRKAIVRSVLPANTHNQDVGLQFVDDIKEEDFTVNPVTNIKKGGIAGQYAKRVGNVVSFLLHKAVRHSAAVSSTSTSFRPVTFNNSLGQKVAGLLDTSFDITEKMKTPMVVIIPAWSTKKESFSALATVITHNFREKGQPIAVLRFDMTNYLGESYKDPEAREPGKECLNITPASILSDIRGAVTFAKNNPFVSVDRVIFISFSFSAPMARRIILEDGGRTVKYWVNAMGCADLAEIMRSVSGGVDFIANYKKGTRLGAISFMGVTSNVDRFCGSAIDLGLDAYLPAKKEFPLLPIPVTSIYGKYDAWIDADHVRELAGLKSDYPRDLIEMPSGHLPKSTEEALENFEVITNKIFHFAHGREIVTSSPLAGTLLKKMEQERSRIKREEVSDVGRYWENYMVGGEKDHLGYDILEYSPDYRRFIELEHQLLDLKPDHLLCDLGCGTGLFEKICFNGNKGRAVPSRIVLTDFVDRILDRAKKNLVGYTNGADISCRLVDLNLSDEVILTKFRQGRYSSLEELKGKQRILSDQTLDRLSERYDGLLHAYLRGEAVPAGKGRYLQLFGEEGWKEIERLHGYFRSGQLLPELRNQGNTSVPLESGSTDRVLISIVLPYLVHPFEMVEEIYRILKPGGIIVASTMRKDSDFSRIFKKTLQAIESRTDRSSEKETLLNQVRSFVNEAAQLWRLTEEGIFQFFTADEFKLLFELAGFHDINLTRGYGDPEQAIIIRATKPVLQS